MLTQTTISGVRLLIFLGHQTSGIPVSPRHMAEQLGESPTYLAKVARLLVRTGILRAHRGVAGGMQLARPPQDITLLAIVEACQGTLLGDYCSNVEDAKAGCAFHQAGWELHQAIDGVLSHWTLAALLARPCPLARHLTDQCLLTNRGASAPYGRSSGNPVKRHKIGRRMA